MCEPYWYGWENGYRSPRSACVAALEVKRIFTSEAEGSKASDDCNSCRFLQVFLVLIIPTSVTIRNISECGLPGFPSRINDSRFNLVHLF